MTEAQLPVPVQDHPHWRVNLRPAIYTPELIPSLAGCYATIEKTRLRLGGWEFPYLSPHRNQRQQGTNWIASWIDFAGHMEYWRFYQSGQFLHLSAVRECIDSRWGKELKDAMRRNLSHLTTFDWSKVNGYVDIQNLNCTISEIFEFAARLSQHGIYEGTVTIEVELRKSRGLLLAAGPGRLWNIDCIAKEENLGRAWEVGSDDLVASGAGHALEATRWFLERFGWIPPNMDPLKKDQERFLKGIA